MGGIVFIININHGWQMALIAGLKQWVYTFLFGGLIIKLLEYVLEWNKNLKYQVMFSVFLISALTSALVYLVHSFKGTPEPFYSTVPTIVLSPPGFMILAFKFKENDKKFMNQPKQDKAS